MNDFSDGALTALSKTSCPNTRPLLVSWNARALYVGPAFNLAAHRNAVAVLVIALGGALGVARDAAKPDLGFVSCKTALIEPNQLHLLATPDAHYAFLYVDALSDDLKTLRQRCRGRVGSLGLDLDNEAMLIALLAGMDRSAAGWQATHERLAQMLSLHPASKDRRVQQAAYAMLNAPAEQTNAAGHAQVAGLSSSRFQHLFKEQTGLSLRRYRLWARLQATMSYVMEGKTLTQAAHDAGFASSAHLSAAFKAMFGLPLSSLLSGNILFVPQCR